MAMQKLEMRMKAWCLQGLKNVKQAVDGTLRDLSLPNYPLASNAARARPHLGLPSHPHFSVHKHQRRTESYQVNKLPTHPLISLNNFRHLA